MLRRAGTRDVGPVAQLWISLTEHHAREDPLYALRPGAEQEVRRLLLATLRDEDAAIWLAEQDGAAQGFCAARIDAAPPIHDETLRAEITDLWVEPSARRRGLGRALVETALAWVAEQEVARVEVRVATRNAEGQGFWRALGFGDFVDVLHRRL